MTRESAGTQLTAKAVQDALINVGSAAATVRSSDLCADAQGDGCPKGVWIEQRAYAGCREGVQPGAEFIFCSMKVFHDEFMSLYHVPVSSRS